MKAITTTYIHCTNCKPNRVKAKAWGVPSIIVSWDDALGVEENHQRVAETLANKYAWLTHEDGVRRFDLTGGNLPNQRGYAFVFTPSNLKVKS